MSEDARIEVRTRCQPTEVQERVYAAISALFPKSTISRDGTEVIAIGDDGSTLRSALERYQVRAAFSGRLHAAARNGTLLFTLSKQAALMGVPSLGVGHPLGELVVQVHLAPTADAHRWVDWLTGREAWPMLKGHDSEE